jgi:hypothetical protein
MACPTPSRKRPTNQPGTRADHRPAASSMADLVGSTACPRCSLGMPRCPPSPWSKGRADRPARHQEGARALTEAAVSFAGNLTDDPEIRYTESSMPEG